MAITGVHALIFTEQPQAIREFLRDVLEWRYVDAHDGWLIFALPPAELGVHPVEGNTGPSHELWLMCDSIAATVAELRAKGITVRDPQDAGFGISAKITLPDGAGLWVYEPRHASPLLPTGTP
jgi:catechol 2,3-dioxygenase-like lactoylglutathione lyase family enzyme